MIIAMKYCGGCNSTYQRSSAVRQLKELYPEHEYVIGDIHKKYDLWLVICGCDKECVETKEMEAALGVRVMGSMEDFRKLYTEFKSLRGSGEASADERKILHIGDKAEFRKTFYFDDIQKFAQLTGDKNRLHMDAEYAKSLGFKGAVVHGVLVASLMSTVMGMTLPGPGTVLMDQQVRHLKPTCIGETIVAEVTCAGAEEKRDCYIGTFTGVCRNAQGDVVAEGSYTQWMDKKIFKV